MKQILNEMSNEKVLVSNASSYITNGEESKKWRSSAPNQPAMSRDFTWGKQTIGR
jgi:hypothetical protein